jgi:hypothetical protein
MMAAFSAASWLPQNNHVFLPILWKALHKMGPSLRELLSSKRKQVVELD